MNQQEGNIDNYRNNFENFYKIEHSIAKHIGLSNLKSGVVTIRNEKGWRENEKSIEYIWIVEVARSFVGWGGIFAIKFNENTFRETLNKEELIHGAFISTENDIQLINTEILSSNLQRKSILFDLNLFDTNKGFTLDGVSYSIRIIASNIDTFIKVANPNTPTWKKWENDILEIGRRLAKDSNNTELINLFS